MSDSNLSETVFDYSEIDHIEIEINTYCNWRCDYCPVKFEPKRAEYMTMDIYDEIIGKINNFPGIKYISLNFYNEPTLDKFFEYRINKVASISKKLIVFTNASMLDSDKIDILEKLNIVEVIRINLPSIEEAEFYRLTQSTTYEQTIRNINDVVSRGFKVEILVNGTPQEIKRNYPPINDYFSTALNARVIPFTTTDRAGLLSNDYAMNYRYKGKLQGCLQVKRLCIGVNGDFLLCSMDYNKKYVLGNIKDGEILDILLSDKAQFIYRQVFGKEQVSEDFICLRCIAAGYSKISNRKRKQDYVTYKQSQVEQ